MHEPDTAADLRWAKAAKRADGLEDLGIGRAVKRYFSMPMPLAVGVSLGVGFALAILWPDAFGGLLPTGLSIGLMLAGIVIFVLGLIHGSKKVSPMVQPQRMGVTVGLTSEEVKLIRRQIWQKESPDTANLQILRGAAIQIREGLAKQLLVSPGVLLFLTGQAVPRGITSLLDLVTIVLLLALVALFVVVVRRFKQTGAFLDATNERENQESDIP